MSPPLHIAIFRLSAIGDVVLAVPMVRAIQQSLPNVKITWIIGRMAFELIDGLSGVDFVVIDKPSSLKDYWQFRRRIKQFNFDVLLAMQASFRANFLYLLIRAKQKIGFDKRRSKDLHNWFIKDSINPKDEHLLEGFMQFALKIGASQPSRPTWQLPISKSDYVFVFDRPYIVINPAASKPERNWGADNYIQLIKAIQQKYPQYAILISGAPNDKKIVEPIVAATKVESMVGKTNLKQLAALLDRAKCVIAPDTGPVHIATAMGTPVIGLYAVITAKLSGPYLSQSLVIDKYPEALQKYLNLTPEKAGWGKRVHHSQAMSLISVNDVLEKLKHVMES